MILRTCKMGLRNMILAGIVLSMLAFITGTGIADINGDNITVIANDTNVDFIIGNTSIGSGDIPTDDIEPYEGSIGPESALYGLKIAFENLEEGFIFNVSEKLGRQVAHARLRIAEAKAELKKNNIKAADRAFERYKEKIDEADDSISRFSGDDSELQYAQEMIGKHKYILQQLITSHPNNTGLERAYNNSLGLEEKFELKIEQKLERMRDEIDEHRTGEEIKIRAEKIGNDTQIEVKITFESNQTENYTIAHEIQDKLQLGIENISDTIEIEHDGGELKDKLEAKARIKRNTSRVEVEYQFPLNTTNRTETIEGVYKKLSALTTEDILRVLEIEIKDNYVKEDKKEERHGIKEERKVTKKEDVSSRRDEQDEDW